MNRYVMCIDNSDYPVSLDQLKVYRIIPDPEAEARGRVRIIDNTGEPYYFPSKRFVPVELDETGEQAIERILA